MKFQFGFLALFACALVVAAEDTPASTPERVCEPGKDFTKDCSVCKCNADGTQYTCEKTECPEGQKVTESTVASEDKCTPGEVFKNKCNECRCPDSGLKSQAACTVIGCPDE